MTPRRTSLSLPLLFLASTLVLGSCKGAPQGPPPGAGMVPEVSTVPVSTQPTPVMLELSGRTSAHRIAEVRPQVGGIIQKRLFTEGSEVKAGDLLYQIDPATYQAALASAEAALARSEAAELSARQKATRYRNLVSTKAVSEQDQIDAEASWRQMVADVAAAKAAVQAAKINLNYTRVTAPISGRIGKSQVSEGALVTAQQATAMATIQQLDPLYVDVAQSSNDLLQLKRKLGGEQKQAAGELKAAVKVVFDDGTEYGETGTLEFSDVTVDQATGMVTIRATVGNPRHELLPGMFVRARLIEQVKQDAILVPQAAVIRDARGRAMVMLVDGQSQVEARSIETGRNVGDKIMVTKGLSGGEQLIVGGLQKIKPGAPVKVAAPQNGAQTPGTPAEQTPARKVE